MSKGLTHAGWCKKCTVQNYNSYLKDGVKRGQISPQTEEMYHNSTNKKNCKSLFGPISF